MTQIDAMSLKARVRRAEQTVTDLAREMAKLEERLAKVELANYSDRLQRVEMTVRGRGLTHA